MHSQQQKEVPTAGNEERTEQCTEELEETLAFRVVILAENLAVELWGFYSETEPDSSRKGDTLRYFFALLSFCTCFGSGERCTVGTHRLGRCR